MDIGNVIAAVVVLGVLGAVFGFVLAVASKVFEVKKDPREEEILSHLAGANCGGCGFPGCAGCAAAILANNFIFSQFLGICPFLGVSKKVDTAVGMGIAVTFILVIASLVQFIEMFLQKSMPSLYTALGIYLPLITTNCAVLGVVLLNVQNSYGFIESVVYGITGGLGFLLAIVLFASIRERLVFADYPKAFEGFPIALVTAGLMALAFMGFSGLKVW